MKNKNKSTLIGYFFIVILSFFALTFQVTTINTISPNILAQDNYGIDGFLDENGKKKDPLDVGISNEEVEVLIKRYLPTAFWIIIGLLIFIIIYQRTQLKKIEKPGLIKIENTNVMLESDIAELIPHYDPDKFINSRYNDFVEIKRAYLTDNRYKLKRKLTDQLFSIYCQEIDGVKARGEVHTIRDTRFRGAAIKNIQQVNTMMILTMELKVCYYEYIEKNHALIYGDRDKKVIVYYELKFITDLRDFVSECPYCGAKSPDTFKRVCEYCNQTVEETEVKWLLNQENVVIKSYGDDI